MLTDEERSSATSSVRRFTCSKSSIFSSLACASWESANSYARSSIIDAKVLIFSQITKEKCNYFLTYFTDNQIVISIILLHLYRFRKPHFIDYKALSEINHVRP